MHTDHSEQRFDIAAIRGDFPILSQMISSQHGAGAGVPLVYLDNAASTQRPRQVIEAMSAFYERDYANVHRGIHTLSERSTERFEAARGRVAEFLGAASGDEIVFTRGTTESINLVARSWGDTFLQPGDEIVLSELEHHANIVPWQQLCARRGTVIRWIGIDDAGRLDMDAATVALSKRTRMVAITAVSNVLGTRTPVTRLAEMAHRTGALLLVDAAQCVPHEIVNVAEWGADFVAFSGHKLLGPTGIGILWGRREHLDAMPPFLGGGSMIRRVRRDGFEPADVPARFEAGTPPIAEAIGLHAALDYLHGIGLENIARHERELTAQAHTMLNTLPGVRIFGPPPEDKAGIVSFIVEGIHAHDVAQILDRHGVAVRAGHHCTMPLHARLGVAATVRASFYLYNTPAEVEQLGKAVAAAQRMFQRGRATRRR